jgi:hypothetical protein
MPSTHQEQELDQLRDRVHKLETMMTAARAVVMHDEPDYAGRCRAAASALRRLLGLPDQRPAHGKRPT